MAERIFENFVNETKTTENIKILTGGREKVPDPIDKEGRKMALESIGVQGRNMEPKVEDSIFYLKRPGKMIVQ